MTGTQVIGKGSYSAWGYEYDMKLKRIILLWTTEATTVDKKAMAASKLC